MWGEHQRGGQADSAPRSTPTRVGRTHHRCESGGSGTVHPHACGENPGRGSDLRPSNGPSPRVWGEPLDLLPRMVVHRSTHTRVGRTANSAAEPNREPGPPTRVWGERPDLPLVVPVPRSTPTRVGETTHGRAGIPWGTGFNPSVGILCVQTLWAKAQELEAKVVSIPRSGFCVFRPSSSACCSVISCTCFNPSVGILCVQTD